MLTDFKIFSPSDSAEIA